MTVKKLTAIYSILVGLSMFGIWAFFLITNSLPLYDERPLEITFHVIAEIMTGAALLAGGIGILKDRSWGLKYFFLGIGMLLYALVNSPGMYIVTKDWIMVSVFPVSFVTAVIFLILALVKKDEFRTED